MKSFRSKPTGWQYEQHRHYLAAKGIKTKKTVYTGKKKENGCYYVRVPSKYYYKGVEVLVDIGTYKTRTVSDKSYSKLKININLY